MKVHSPVTHPPLMFDKPMAQQPDMQASLALRGRRMTVVFNPTAGGRRRARLDETLRLLRDSGCEVAVQATAARGDAETIARAFGGPLRAQDLLVIAGGDGTINEAVNGLLSGGGEGAASLALVPLGTANVLANEIGLATAPAAVARAIVRGASVRAYVGVANGRCFTAMAGAGFDAHVIANVGPRLKRLFGRGAYVMEALRQLWRFPFPRYRVTLDGQGYDAASVIVAKGHFYGGRYVCAPDARLDRPEFHVCLFERGGRWNAIRYALALALGRLPRLADFRILRGRVVTIDGPAGDPLQGDGDIIACLPARLEIAPRPLRLIVPPDFDGAA